MFVPATDADVPRIVELMNRACRGARNAVVLEKELSPDGVRS